jgi:hypothetical protein
MAFFDKLEQFPSRDFHEDPLSYPAVLARFPVQTTVDCDR